MIDYYLQLTVNEISEPIELTIATYFISDGRATKMDDWDEADKNRANPFAQNEWVIKTNFYVNNFCGPCTMKGH